MTNGPVGLCQVGVHGTANTSAAVRPERCPIEVDLEGSDQRHMCRSCSLVSTSDGFVLNHHDGGPYLDFIVFRSADRTDSPPTDETFMASAEAAAGHSNMSAIRSRGRRSGTNHAMARNTTCNLQLTDHLIKSITLIG